MGWNPGVPTPGYVPKKAWALASAEHTKRCFVSGRFYNPQERILLTLASPEPGGPLCPGLCLELRVRSLSLSPFHHPRSALSLVSSPWQPGLVPTSTPALRQGLCSPSPPFSHLSAPFSLSLPLPQSLSPAESPLWTTHCVYKTTRTVFYFSLSPFLP